MNSVFFLFLGKGGRPRIYLWNALCGCYTYLCSIDGWPCLKLSCMRERKNNEVQRQHRNVCSQIFLCEKGLELKPLCPCCPFTAFFPPSHWSTVPRGMRAEAKGLKPFSKLRQSLVVSSSVAVRTLWWEYAWKPAYWQSNKNFLMVNHQIEV